MIIVTGASRGLGNAITEHLIDKGEDVIGIARSIENTNIDAIECDVSDYSSLKDVSKN